MSDQSDPLARDGETWRAEIERRHSANALAAFDRIGSAKSTRHIGSRPGARGPLYLSMVSVLVIGVGVFSAIAVSTSSQHTDGDRGVAAPPTASSQTDQPPASTSTTRPTADGSTGGASSLGTTAQPRPTNAAPKRTDQSSATLPKPPPSSSTQCTAARLTVTLSSSAGTGGYTGFSFYFTNVSKSTCTLSGYPGVAALSSSGSQAIQANRTLRGYQGGLPTGNDTIPTIKLQAGQRATAHLEWADRSNSSDNSSCHTYPGVLVTAPDTTRASRLTPTPMYVCSHFDIHPVVPA